MLYNKGHIFMLRILANFFCLLLIFLHSAQADKASKLNEEGIEAYKNQKAEESVRYFTDALVERPESPELRFNRGTALSAAGKTEDAVNELNRAAAGFPSKDFSAAAYFNAGNTLFAAGDIEKAIEQYKQAVKLDQTSKDIRHNLELALQKREQQQQQQEQQQNQDQDKQDQDQNKENEEKQDQNEQNNEDKEQQDQNQQEQEQENQPESEEQEQQQQSHEQTEQPMTPEEAKRILDAMNDEEKKALELRKQIMQEAAKQGDDW